MYTFLRDFRFETKKWYGSWKDRIMQAVSHEMKVLKPQMPWSRWADYEAWQIWFERQLVENNDDVDSYIFIWLSLGAMFLVRYLSENIVAMSIDQIHLISWWYYQEWYGGFSLAHDQLPKILHQVSQKNMYIYHSRDDISVPFADGYGVLHTRFPEANFEAFETRWHFLQPAFPELLDNIGIYTR